MELSRFICTFGEDAMQKIIYSLIALSLSLLPISLFSDEEDSGRGGIEEITVTAEKRTSTVSDTSM